MENQTKHSYWSGMWRGAQLTKEEIEARLPNDKQNKTDEWWEDHASVFNSYVYEVDYMIGLARQRTIEKSRLARIERRNEEKIIERKRTECVALATKEGRTEYIVKTAAACMPSSCWGRYGKIAVMEVYVGAQPKMISDRARGCKRVVRIWDRLNIGSTERCAFSVAEQEAYALAHELNHAQA